MKAFHVCKIRSHLCPARTTLRPWDHRLKASCGVQIGLRMMCPSSYLWIIFIFGGMAILRHLSWHLSSEKSSICVSVVLETCCSGHRRGDHIQGAILLAVAGVGPLGVEPMERWAMKCVFLYVFKRPSFSKQQLVVWNPEKIWGFRAWGEGGQISASQLSSDWIRFSLN